MLAAGSFLKSSCETVLIKCRMYGKPFMSPLFSLECGDVITLASVFISSVYGVSIVSTSDRESTTPACRTDSIMNVCSTTSQASGRVSPPFEVLQEK